MNLLIHILTSATKDTVCTEVANHQQLNVSMVRAIQLSNLCEIVKRIILKKNVSK